jgi:hypothetical protein
MQQYQKMLWIGGIGIVSTTEHAPGLNARDMKTNKNDESQGKKRAVGATIEVIKVNI